MSFWAKPMNLDFLIGWKCEMFRFAQHDTTLILLVAPNLSKGGNDF